MYALKQSKLTLYNILHVGSLATNCSMLFLCQYSALASLHTLNPADHLLICFSWWKDRGYQQCMFS